MGRRTHSTTTLVALLTFIHSHFSRSARPPHVRYRGGVGEGALRIPLLVRPMVTATTSSRMAAAAASSRMAATAAVTISDCVGGRGGGSNRSSSRSRIDAISAAE